VAADFGLMVYLGVEPGDDAIKKIKAQ
jgi:hypothetical protein